MPDKNIYYKIRHENIHKKSFLHLVSFNFKDSHNKTDIMQKTGQYSGLISGFRNTFDV